MLFGDVTLARVKDPADLRRLLPDYVLDSETLVVKPNWFSCHPGNFTNAETLRFLLEALGARVVAIEGYTLERQDGSMRFNVDGEEVDWRWILRNPSWEWVKEGGRWDEIRRQDAWFLEEFGFKDLFEEFDVEYVNVTEEAWKGLTVDPTIVKDAVEEKFSPAFTDKLYGFLPKRLHDLRGAPLISYGKVKGIGGTYPSLTLKNLFGLIPDPLRSWWHGPDDGMLADNIVDIAKVYSTVFETHGICEAINEVTISHPEGAVKAPWGSYNIARDLGVVAIGSNLVSLDAVLCGLIRVDPETVYYLQSGEEVFGQFSRLAVNEAELASKEWFPV